VVKPLSRVAVPVRLSNGHVLAVQTELVPLELSSPAPAARRWFISPPLLLGLLQALVSVGLVWVELAEPPPQRGLLGMYFSNVINSDGARAALHLYRRRFDWLPLVGSDHILSPRPYLWSLRTGLILLMLIQAAAVWCVLKEDRPSIRRWVVGPVISTFALLVYPPINTDVFYYAAVGQVANRGGNPYLQSPKSFGPSVFDRYSDWEHITAPYGPIWTAVSRVIDAATGTSPFASSLGFKLLSGITAIGLSLVTARLAKRLTGDHRLEVLAFVLMAWSPIVLYESAGTAHFEPLLMLLALSGLLVLTSEGRGRVRAGLLLIAASALCKPVTLPLLGSAALVRFAKRDDPLRLIVRRWAIDAAAILALVAVAYARYWDGGRLPRALFDNSRTLYVDKPLRANPFWIWLVPRLGIHGGWLPEKGANIAQAVASLLILAAVVWLVRREYLFYKQSSALTPSPMTLLRTQISLWAVVMLAEAHLPPNAHAWYMIWALPLMALIAVDAAKRSQIPKRTALGVQRNDVYFSTFRTNWLFTSYVSYSFAMFFVYHTWTWG
jgi:hypothetical protein